MQTSYRIDESNRDAMENSFVTVQHQAIEVALTDARDIPAKMCDYQSLYDQSGEMRLSRHPGWLSILHRSLRHQPYCVEGYLDRRLAAILPLVAIRGPLFGSFLVSLPYLNAGGVIRDPDLSPESCQQLDHALVRRAADLADRLNVRFLELRNEAALDHPNLTEANSSKVHMQLNLPSSDKELWDGFKDKVRNEVRKGQKNSLTVHWGGTEWMDEFYQVFSHNMRDLGTPVYGAPLFHEILTQFSDRSELCVVRQGTKTLAAAILLHGEGVTEVPSASSLRAYKSTNANMLMYWHLLVRAIERGQRIFDFGRSSPDHGTFRFKKQWGATPSSAIWQYYVRRGSIHDMRPENSKYERRQAWWRRLPLPIANFVGPIIVRGIP
jgi:FemAB-related protein (PEP-CTERM system-associated)